MQTQNRLLDDLARMAGGALDVAAGMRAEVEGRLREQFEAMLARMDLVTREEFDAVKAMAAKAREEQEQLAERVAALEAALGTTSGAAPGAAKKSTRKRATKKATAKAKTTGRKTGD